MPTHDVLIRIASQSDDWESVLATRSLTGDPHDEGYEISIAYRNHDSLASVYNEVITEKNRNKIAVFMHDDLYLADDQFVSKCNSAVKMFDVFGVAGGAGSLNIKPEQPALWHLISERRVGFAGHYLAQDCKPSDFDEWGPCFMTSFGISPAEATLLDGILIGAKVSTLLDNDLRFDENCPSRFHFYDLLFSVNAKLKGLKVGVFPFNVFHKSHGLTNPNEEFFAGEKYFKEHCTKISKKGS